MLVRERPEILVELLVRATGYSPPIGATLREESADFTQAVPHERRADAVFVMDRDGAPQTAFVLEVQLEIDEEKRFSWPLYAASLHAKTRCATHLVVIAPISRVAAWARRPIPTCHRFAPVVIGPAEIPRICDAEEAKRIPELAVLSALVHGGRSDGEGVIEAMLAGVAPLDEAQSATYLDLVLSTLPPAARAAMEKRMTQRPYEYKSDLFRKPYLEGRAEGERRALSLVLHARGIALSDAARARVEACQDVAVLERWLARAATIARDEDLFSDD